MNKVFIGFDPRQPVSFWTLAHSITMNAKEPVAIIPLKLETLPMKRQGLTPFTYSRFLVPYLCRYEGHALFLDSDMLCLGDISEVFAYGVHAGLAAYAMTEQKPFEWASMILFNCEHPSNKKLSLSHVENPEVRDLHKIGWLKPEEIGHLPKEWNVCVGYEDNPPADAKLVHFTQGVPHWWETEGGPYAQAWTNYRDNILFAEPWVQLMGPSVHAEPVIKRLVAQGKIKDHDDYVARVRAHQ